MVDGFLHLDVQPGAARRLADDVAWLAVVGGGPAAWEAFLRIAALVFDNPGRGFHELEVGVRHGRYRRNEDSLDDRQSNRCLHSVLLCCRRRKYTTTCQL